MGSFSRRGLLAALGTSAALAGCSSIPGTSGETEQLDLGFFNFSSYPLMVVYELLDPDAETYPEARVLSNDTRLAPASGPGPCGDQPDGENQERRVDVAPATRYELRVSVGGAKKGFLDGCKDALREEGAPPPSDRHRHYHFRPESGENSLVVQLFGARRLDSDYRIEFRTASID